MSTPAPTRIDFKDHFSAHAAAYAQARPQYPVELFQWLASQCAGHALAVDVGCGNGQASLLLATHFAQVRAFDPSIAQLGCARMHERVHYAVAPAEQLPLEAASADLLVVAQALHWFDFPRFFTEAQRVLRPGAHFCTLHYPLLRVSAWIDRHIEHFESQVVGSHWPAERRHIDNAFSELQFPFAREPSPAFAMCQHWTLAQLLDYLRTWSAVQRYQEVHGHDPVAALGVRLLPCWGDPQQRRQVSWPLHIWLGKRS